MKIFDCFMFYDEKTLLDIRLNILNEYVDYFVIVESKYFHNGKERELKFNINEFSKPIQIGNNYLILMVNDIRNKKILIDKENELEKLIDYERNKQLDQFSKIYFNKAKINYSIIDEK